VSAGGGSGAGAMDPSGPVKPAEDRVERPEDALDAQAGARAQASSAVVPRWVQLVLLPIALLALWVVAKAAGKVLMMFIVAAIIALILNPLVAFLQRAGVRRGLAVLAVYVGFFLVVTGGGYLLAQPIAEQVHTFAHDVPHIVSKANRGIVNLQHFLNRDLGMHVQFVTQGKTALQTLGAKIAKSSTAIAETGGALLKEAAGAVFDVVVVFVLSVYMLLYGERIGRLVRSVMPGAEHAAAEGKRRQRIRADDYPTLVERAVSRYVGGQLLFSLVMGASAGLALYVFGLAGVFPDGRKFALAFGTFYGFMELVPYIGPFLGALPPLLVALFTEPLTAVWLALLFLALQQIEGHVVAPQVFGRTLRINPLLVLFALLFGLQVRGVVGALVALPVLSVLRETALYLRRHLVLESWGSEAGPLL
jgi:predicted PurR-regulated permease PerM